MNIEKVVLVYFSPTGNVRRTIMKIAEGADVPVREIDLTAFDARWRHYTFSDNELVIIGCPVYNKRLPEISPEIFRTLKPNHTPVASFVSYGNDDYGDALLELNDLCREHGFHCIASAAFIGEHAMAASLAAGRPNAEDDSAATAFGRQIMRKAASGGIIGEVSVPGNFPYRFHPEMQAAPDTGDSCRKCGKCAQECPVHAINPSAPAKVDARRCIQCTRCIHICPSGAKKFTNEKYIRQAARFEGSFKCPMEPEIFI